MKLILSLLILLSLQAQAWQLCEPNNSRPDADTFYLCQQEQRQKIRLYGVDAPEKNQPIGIKALQERRQLMKGKQIAPACQGGKTYKRDVCRVSVQGVDLGLWLVRQGYAFHDEEFTKSDEAYAVQLNQAEREASKQGVGVWTMPGGGVRPWHWRRR